MTIGLIAMSGVRANNKELMEYGLTLPGFVERSEVIASMPSLSLLTLAALTPKDIKVEYLEINDLQKQGGLRNDFDLVALSSYSAQVFEAYELADEYLKNDIPVVMGGLHVSVLPEEAKRHCTSVVIGEGELLWPQVIKDFRSGQLKDHYRANPGETFDLALAPIPRFELLDISKYNRLTVQTSRGCPHRCDFCASSTLLTPKYKVKPIEKVIEEIRYIKTLWEHPFIEFADDNSFVAKRHYKDLLKILRYENIRWFTETDISVAEDEELLALMFESGCKQVLIGLESPKEPGIDNVEQRQNWKRKKCPDYERAIKKIQSHGITVNGCFILGLDGNTEDVFEDIYEFIKRAGLFEVQITILTPFPGTPLYKRLKEEGRLLEDNAWNKCTLFDINFIPKQMSVEALYNGMIGLSKRIYNREFIEQRQRGFFKVLRERKYLNVTV